MIILPRKAVCSPHVLLTLSDRTPVPCEGHTTGQPNCRQTTEERSVGLATGRPGVEAQPRSTLNDEDWTTSGASSNHFTVGVRIVRHTDARDGTADPRAGRREPRQV